MKENLFFLYYFQIFYSLHVYVGSANADWRSLSQVKELGVLVQNSPSIAADLQKIFKMYQIAAQTNQIPNPWPSDLDTIYNLNNPLKVLFLFINILIFFFSIKFFQLQTTLNGQPVELFLASSPSAFCTPERTGDIDALLNAIKNAEQSICIEVMDYSASSLYYANNYYWPVISDALSAAAYNKKVQVKLLIARWNYTIKSTIQFAEALNSMDNIEVRLMIIPDLVNLQNGTF